MARAMVFFFFILYTLAGLEWVLELAKENSEAIHSHSSQNSAPHGTRTLVITGEGDELPISLKVVLPMLNVLFS